MKLSSIILLIGIVSSWPISELRTLQISETNTVIVHENEKLKLKRDGINFIDVTHFPNFISKENNDVYIPKYNYPTSPRNIKVLNSANFNVNKTFMYENLATFTSFYTRYYKSEYGYDSFNWLFKRICEVVKPLETNITVTSVDHKHWKQRSIIVSITGVETPENIIVVGSHQDSSNLIFPSLLSAPGADDNGSGTITNLEALRIYINYLMEANHWPENTIEFHFYSAEEGGLLGSMDIFSQYAADKKKVIAMLQQDMTGYVNDPDNEHVGVVIDYTTPELTTFIKMIINSYLSIPYVETKCGYACSDHASALKNGFPAAFVIESDMKKTNYYIHTTMDTLDRLSFDHMGEHVKLVIGYLLELENWKVQLSGE